MRQLPATTVFRFYDRNESRGGEVMQPPRVHNSVDQKYIPSPELSHRYPFDPQLIHTSTDQCRRLSPTTTRALYRWKIELKVKGRLESKISARQSQRSTFPVPTPVARKVQKTHVRQSASMECLHAYPRLQSCVGLPDFGCGRGVPRRLRHQILRARRRKGLVIAP